MHLLTVSFRSALAALMLSPVACDPQSTGAEAAPRDAPWCAVETGLPGNTGDHRQVALHAQPIRNVSVLREPLGVTTLEYHDRYNDQNISHGPPPSAQASRLADGTWLVSFAAPGPWGESTSALLQLDPTGGIVSVRSAHLSWTADVPPLHAWTALDGGWVHIDDTDLHTAGRVRIDFRLEGEIVGANGPPPSGPVRVWSTGRIVLTLKDGVLPPLPDEQRAWFEALAAGR
jgi:hypothetical protein